ncbi:hemerythrin HHE cation binding domain protein [Paraburkholderia fungorum]|jgi:hemerythrin-like domain-containing protein|uniref:Hemerythrin HHE cation binding domain protein n=1 Tax=Paraburkholderia fungorum TaxID=134537 RepID=A0AAP5UYD3_9BURK|nr:hemerythrin domain-containing protein [Paraburkholderia fungorum]AJZ56562.1 hemerythrin HHE cation binding domain protein [Paraburkholderia fungorum]MDT8843298.1 hemerythrin domain-containing protein [Paraburkholderia fungorum]
MPSLGPRNAITVILREHEQMSTVIEGMRCFVGLLAAGTPAPGLMVLRAMLYYIREYPQQVHHPKEDRYLFAPLRDRTDEFDHVLTELESQHAQGDVRLRNIEHALTRYELQGPPALRELRAKVDAYAEFHADHRCMEETLILPAARRLLTNEDWTKIDAIFGANRDPFDGVKREDDLGKLFSMIVKTIPETEN